MRDATLPRSVQVAIIGAGPAGICLATLLEQAGLRDFVVLEKADGVGGTWRWSTYPGAECDVPSHLYSYSFAPNPDWSKTFAGQQEILAYFERCAETAGILDRVHCSTGVQSLEWSERARRWTVRTRAGDELHAGVVASAVGMFNAPAIPHIAGLDTFSGPILHSARWDHTVELDGKRIGVVGTGASAIQIVPAIAARAGHLTVFQRSAPWIMPRADKPFTNEDKRRFRTDPAAMERVRQEAFAFYEGNTLMKVDDERRPVFESYARNHLEASVPDPVLRAKLTPDYPIGCKRILLSNDYYPTLQQPHVELVTEPIERVTDAAVVTTAGTHPLDVLVLATGYRATDYLHGLEVIGRDGMELHEHWGDEPRAYLGMTVPGFPNLFVFYGPNTNQAGNSILIILEAQARYIVAMIQEMARHDVAAVEVKESVFERYNAEIDAAMEGTVWVAGCHNYFLSPSGRVTTQLPHRSHWYEERTARVELDDYELTARA